MGATGESTAEENVEIKVETPRGFAKNEPPKDISSVEAGESCNEDNEKERNNLKQTIFLLTKSFIASGVLFLPKAFLQGGLVFSPTFIFFINLVCIYSFLKLYKVYMVLRKSFSEMSDEMYGKWFRYIVQVCIIFSQLGFCCSYFSFMQQNLGTVISEYTSSHLTALEWTLIFLAAWTPFVMARKISRYNIPALIADGCIVVGLLYIFVYCAKRLNDNGLETKVRLVNWDSIGVCIGTAVFAFEGVNMVVPIAESMKRPEKFPLCLTSVLMGVCVVLASIGTIGYVTFGDNVAEIVTLNLSHGAGQLFVIIIYCFAVFFTLPLMFFPAMQIIEPLIWKKEDGKERFTLSKTKVLWLQNLLRFALLAIVAMISYAARSNLTNFISIVGSCTGGPLCFIFPPLLHIKAISKTKKEKICDIVLIIFGVGVFVFTLYESIIKW